MTEFFKKNWQLQAIKKKFLEAIQRYQDIERTFEMKLRQRIERQILIGRYNMPNIFIIMQINIYLLG